MAVLRGLLVLLVAGLAGFGGVGSASADPYPPDSCGQAAVSAMAVTPQGSITVTGSEYVPGDRLAVMVDSFTLAHTTADAAGTFRVTVTLPAGMTGDRQLIVIANDTTCATAPITLSIHDAAAETGTGGGALASTGVRIAAALGAGAVLIVVGFVAVRAGRRRRA